MATVQDVTPTSWSTEANPQSADLPATVNADELLMLFVSFSNVTITKPTGWTTLYNVAGNPRTYACFLKKADGTEGGTTVTLNLNADRAGTAQCYRITDWSEDVAGVEFASAIDTGADTAPDPPSLTHSAGSAAYLWLAIAHSFDDDEATTSYPANYTDGIDTACGGPANGNGRTASARRALEAATEDPGTFTLADNENWAGATVAIPPADDTATSALATANSSAAAG